MHRGFLVLVAVLMSVWTPTVLAEGDPEAGITVYKNNCAACHGAGGEGGIGPSLTDNSFVSGSADAAIIEVVITGRDDMGMPGFEDQITEEQIQNVVALLKNPDVFASASQNTVTFTFTEPEIDTSDVTSGLKRSFIFVYLWTLIAMGALLAWIKHKG